MRLYTENGKKIIVLLSTFGVDLFAYKVTTLLYIKVVCIVSIKQAWSVAVITLGNNTMLIKIS